MRKYNPSIIIQNHPDDYDGLPFVSMLRCVTKTTLALGPVEWSNIPVVIHNVKTYEVDYIDLDLIALRHGPEYSVQFISVVQDWWNNGRQMPVGFWLEKHDIPFHMSTAYGKKAMKTKKAALTIIGPAPHYCWKPLRTKRVRIKHLTK